MEKDSKIDESWARLMKEAYGDVLETCVGENLNETYFDNQKLKFWVAIDWHQEIINQIHSTAGQKTKLMEMDIHDLQFKDASFDTVVDTFGLECAYNPEEAFKEMKRVVWPGGKIILLERGMGVWLF